MNKPEPSTKPFLPLSRGKKIVLASLLLVSALLTLLPIAIKHLAINLLKDQGISQIEIADVDLNLFSGEFGLSDVQLSGNGQGRASLSRLYLNLSMLALLSKRIELEQLELSGLELDLDNTITGDWIIAGTLPPPASATTEPEPENSPWGIGIRQSKLETISVHLSSPKLQTDLHIDSLQLNQLASWLPQQTSDYQAQLRIGQAPLLLSGEMQPFKASPEFSGKLQLQQLPLMLVAELARDAGINKLNGELNLQTEFTAKLEAGKPNVQSQTHINLDKLEMTQGQYQVSNQQLDWDGQLNYQTPDNDQDLGLRLNGTVTVKQFTLQDNQANLQLALFEQLQLNDIELTTAQQLNIKQIDLNQLTLLHKQADEMVKLTKATLTTLAFDGKQMLNIDTVDLNGLTAKIKITADGKIQLLDQLQAGTATPADTPAETPESTAIEEDTSKPFQIKLAQLNIANNNQIIFTDESVKPAFHAEIKPMSLSIANIDSSKPDQDVLLKLQASINQHSELNLDAQIRPFGPKLNMSAKGNISALELPPASPYANKQMGYYLKRGQLNSSINATVKDDQLDANIHIKLNKFNIEEGDPGQSKKFSENLSMPLDAALELLRDKQDNIKLDIKIDGDINDPQFDVSKVINKALAKATGMAVTGYLKFMLQPWGAMLMVAEMVGQPGSVNLEPVVFSAAETRLSDEHQQYLNKIAALLQERPNIELNICGLASEADRQALLAKQQQTEQGTAKQKTASATEVVSVTNEQLLELANERSRLIKELLIGQGIDAGRLFSCHPNMEAAETNPAQVLLTI